MSARQKSTSGNPVLDFLMILLIVVQAIRVVIAVLSGDYSYLGDVITITALAATVLMRNRLIGRLSGGGQ